MWLDTDKEQRAIDEAKCELTEAEALKVLLTNNTLAAEIHIAGMKMGVCANSWLLPIIDKQIGEINKFLNNEPNLWE